MAIKNKRLKRRLFRIFPVLAALIVLLVSLVLVSGVRQDSEGYNQVYIWVLVLTVVSLVLLFIAIVSRFFSLYRKVRAEEPGARLSARWVRNFLFLSIPPALVVYLFAAWFLTDTVDNWFSVEVESALSDSLSLGQEFLDQRTLDVRNQVREIGAQIDPRAPIDDTRRQLLANVRSAGPEELSLLDLDGRVRATANYNALADLPERPEDYALLQARERGEYAAAEPVGDGRLRIRVLQRLAAQGSGDSYLLQAIYPLPDAITDLTSSIEEEYHRYQNVSFLRGSLKKSFLLILSLVLLLTVLLAILAALTAARRMVIPLYDLAKATRNVAEGDLKQAVQTDGNDEISFLSQSFNEMTDALVHASEEAESSRARLAAQGEYLETVLGSLSAGVLSLDSNGHLIRVNRAAYRILGLEPGSAEGLDLGTMAEKMPWLEPLTIEVARQLERRRAGWQQEILLERSGTPLVLLVRGSSLAGLEGDDGGHVVVFDDVTVLNQAQREAAWSEVAQRLAHEVKNPLTPIRLAAERMRMKLMDRLEPKDAQMLDKSATTIVAQVEALRKLVDAFGDYAKEPELALEPIRLDSLINEVIELYRQGDPHLAIEPQLVKGPDGLSADSGQIRQLLHNLIRNAIEAVDEGQHARISIVTRVIERDGQPALEMEIRDHGPGFPQPILDQPFEPYVTHKPGGSGLGLAICRKIVSDHDGSISIFNNDDGACALISLPLKSEGTVQAGDRQKFGGGSAGA